MTDASIAPAGKLWVCMACGRYERNRNGSTTPGWDEACMLNAQLFEAERLVIDTLAGRVIAMMEPAQKTG